MNILILGAAGFLGTNLTLELMKDENNNICIVDKSVNYFQSCVKSNNVSIIESSLCYDTNFTELTVDIDVVYHLVSTTVPSTANQSVSQELLSNVVFTSNLLDACVANKVKKVVFISSGGTVYGNNVQCPIHEDSNTDPISSYGVQKLSIEKLLYLYHHMHGLNYRIIRLANPYGPYQRPNGMLGAVTTFTYKALKGDEICVFGDGTVIRDYIYIDDVVSAIKKIVDSDSPYKLYNLGSGQGTSLKQVLSTISNTLGLDIFVTYKEKRNVDVKENYLDISRYESVFGELNPLPLDIGIRKTAEFLKETYCK